MDQSSRTFFLERRRNRAGNISFQILDILSRSGDIRDQSQRLCKMDRNFACFWPPNFFGREPPNFGSWIIKQDQFPIMWQSFTVIGRGISEITRWKKKKHHEHFISPPVTPYGRPNNNDTTTTTTTTTTTLVALWDPFPGPRIAYYHQWRI